MNQRFYDTLDKLSKLPDKFVDTKLVFIGLLLHTSIVYGAVAVAQLKAVNACIAPIPSSLVK